MRAPKIAKDVIIQAPEPEASMPLPEQPRTGRGRNPKFEVALGARIRAARLVAGMSQVDLGSAIGVSFQQVQKYELGKDRVSVSTLQVIATALRVHPGSFFEDASASIGSVPDVKTFAGGVEMFQRIRNPRVRKRLLALTLTLMHTEDDQGEPTANASSEAN